jgi:hypothetical protein
MIRTSLFKSFLELLVLDCQIIPKMLMSMCIIYFWQSEYPKYTPLLAKILEGLLSQSNIEDKIHHDEEVNTITSLWSN